MDREKLANELAKVWGNGSKMVDYCMESSVYIEIEGMFIDLMSKPSIDKTMYYDDEYQAPSKDMETFIEYNLRHNFKFNGDMINWDLPIILREQYNKKSGSLKSLVTYKYLSMYEGDKFPNDIVLDPEHYTHLRHEIRAQKVAYIKRLHAYWKRYGDKVRTFGYWANR